jgi:hypothetical protein
MFAVPLARDRLKPLEVRGFRMIASGIISELTAGYRQKIARKQGIGGDVGADQAISNLAI